MKSKWNFQLKHPINPIGAEVRVEETLAIEAVNAQLQVLAPKALAREPEALFQTLNQLHVRWD